MQLACHDSLSTPASAAYCSPASLLMSPYNYVAKGLQEDNHSRIALWL